MINVLRIHPQDNVVVALVDLAAGTPLESSDGLPAQDLTARALIPFGHKIAIAPIGTGEEVIKYGASIGVATTPVTPGEHVHIHNLRSVRGVVHA